VIQRILQSNLSIFLCVVVGYLLIHFTNNVLTEFLYLLPGAHLIHIPSGFELLFVLIAGWLGALGIATAALIASIVYKFPDEYLLGFQLAVANGLAPYIARRWVIAKLEMNDDLSEITVKQLVALGLVFALLNSALNQAILYWNGIHKNFLDGTFVMFIGDMTGAYIVFLLLKLLSKKLVKVNEPDKG